MYKLLVVFSREAQSYTEKHGIEKLLTVKAPSIAGQQLKKGYDWDLKEFQTLAERKAYIQGMEDMNGWMSDPEYLIINPEAKS
jgi:hypothetical protein